MANSWSGPIRRSQLIAPFGVGALYTIPGGVSLITGGLDLWYTNSSGSSNAVDIEDYKVHEWRLESILNVDHFRLPPDYREAWQFQAGDQTNFNIIVPAFRFPTWHFCPNSKCRTLTKRTLFERGSRGKISCPNCGWPMFQVPFVAVCKEGHIQDFPWNEWVHRSSSPKCDGQNLKLYSSGQSTLAGQIVKCTDCGKTRSLFGITSAQGESTILSRELENGRLFLCRGQKPWIGTDESFGCGAPLRGALRGASNVYFSQVYSSVFLPKVQGEESQEVEDVLESTAVSATVDLLFSVTDNLADVVKALRKHHEAVFRRFSDQAVEYALQAQLGNPEPETGASDGIDEHPDVSFRRMEFNVIRRSRNEKELVVEQPDYERYESEVRYFFDRILLIKRLRETKVLAGFTRIYPEVDKPTEELTAMMWKEKPEEEKWLPAHIVYGEGIYFELSEPLLQAWEQRKNVKERIQPLINRYKQIQDVRKLKDRAINPRFILIHTLAHIMMNQLTFESGYSSAALRERLYVSDDLRYPMAGCLIYTANGDSEGTLGGLVRLGAPGSFDKTVRRALEKAVWCSADPVCQEAGRYGGQGPDSCNLAACHGCTLVPEPACEEFNRFLDRGVLVGDLQERDLGYFSGVV